MAITNGYCTLAEAKVFLAIADVTDDTAVEIAVSAASRLIDGATRRRFFAATETRYYTPRHPASLLTHDLLSVTTLKTDEDGDGTYEITWATTDFMLLPQDSLDQAHHPYWEIRTRPLGNYVFPVGVPAGVSVLGSWGFSATTPDLIKQACIIQSGRLFKRRDSIFGMAGSPELGVLSALPLKGGLDPDVYSMLDQGGYIRGL